MSKGEEDFVKVSKAKLIEYEQLESLFNITEDWLCIADFNGFFKKINPAVSKLLGYTEEELLSRPIIDFVYKEDKNLTSSSRKNVYGGSFLINFENRYQTKSGEIVWLSWTSIPHLASQRVFAVAKNVSLKKAEEEERIAFIAQLNKINEDMKNFTQMTSHDMRSPVNNVLAISSLLDSTTIQDPKAVELVQLLKVASKDLHGTIDNFVDVIINTDKIASALEEVDLEKVLAKVTQSIGSLIKSTTVEIYADFEAVKTVVFNKVYLESIFLNLITNSIKYAHPDRAPIIKITTVLSQGRTQLRFTDNGLGFDLAHVKDKIFGLYQMFHHHSDSKGMGLHLVHQHVTSLGGQISIESKLNEGATFVISFKG